MGKNTAAEREAAKALWLAQEKDMRTVLWPAPGKDDHLAADNLAVFARLRPLEHKVAASSSPALQRPGLSDSTN